MYYYNYPIISSLGFILPILYSFYNEVYFNTYFFNLLLCNYILSILFWSNPISNKNEFVHKIDAIYARITILSFILYKYIIYNKNIGIFGFNLIIVVIFFLLSNKYSTQSWCCKSHIFFHIMAHISASITGFFAIL